MREWMPSAPTRLEPWAVVPSAKCATTCPSCSVTDDSDLPNSKSTPASAAASRSMRLSSPRMTRDAADRRFREHAAGLVVKDQPIVLESESIETCTEAERAQHGQPVRRDVEKHAGIVSRTVARLIDDRLDARAL